MDSKRLAAALTRARQELLAARNSAGHWEGELSSSALSTATAVCALAVVERESGGELASSLEAIPLSPSRGEGVRRAGEGVGGFLAGEQVRKEQGAFHALIERGLQWLADHANADGGWGDTVLSLSNISTTTLCWAAFGVVPGAEERHRAVVDKAGQWLRRQAGGLDPDTLAPAIIARYGKDRTFSVPILTMCALAGRLGSGAEAWRHVLSLPFELAALPHHWFTIIRLPVVSYALPALIAIGQARHHHRPTRNPLTRFLRNATRRRTLDVLRDIQPSSGGFLEATPLTSFVTMSLAASGQVENPVTRKAVEFLVASARADGSWPIDTNLATWVTTLSVNALCAGGTGVLPVVSGVAPETSLDATESVRIRDWLLGQQYKVIHPYTDAAPGGWAWTNLPGGVPDADDTAGALLALKNLACCQRPAKGAPGVRSAAVPAAGSGTVPVPGQGAPTRRDAAGTSNRDGCTTPSGCPASEAHPITPSLSPSGGEGARTRDLNIDERTLEAAKLGLEWLLQLQNRDGGIPTFCRGWTNLPFDRSSPDLTAHAIRAWTAWRPLFPQWEWRLHDAVDRALRYLTKTRQPRRGWIPLWFGNQHAPDDENPTYGTAKVLLALQELDAKEFPEVDLLLAGAVMPLIESQREDGSWGGGREGPASVEETALVVGALAGLLRRRKGASRLLAQCAGPAVARGTRWLIERVEAGDWTQPSPIGFYFAKLWYYEKLYPLIFTVGALNHVGGNADSLRNSQDAKTQEDRAV